MVRLDLYLTSKDVGDELRLVFAVFPPLEIELSRRSLGRCRLRGFSGPAPEDLVLAFRVL